jgi:hypothetical protein
MTALLVDQVMAADPDPRLGGRRPGGEQDARGDEQREGRPAAADTEQAPRQAPWGRSAQTATRSGARTRRENVIAPSSSDP